MSLLTLVDNKKRFIDLNWHTNFLFFRFTLRDWAVTSTCSTNSSDEWIICLCLISLSYYHFLLNYSSYEWRHLGAHFINPINPWGPHDASKHHCKSMKTYLIFQQPEVSEWNFHKSVYQYMTIFFNFFTHFKSSSSTTSRELRQQFAACSGWRWHVKSGLKGLTTGHDYIRFPTLYTSFWIC